MLGAERNHALAMLGGKDDVAGDKDHGDKLLHEANLLRPASLMVKRQLLKLT
jgi:hypothetical protein